MIKVRLFEDCGYKETELIFRVPSDVIQFEQALKWINQNKSLAGCFQSVIVDQDAK